MVSVPSRGFLFQSAMQFFLLIEFSFYLPSFKVSVPSRGFLFQSFKKDSHTTRSTWKVSVPSRGFLFQSMLYVYYR